MFFFIDVDYFPLRFNGTFSPNSSNSQPSFFQLDFIDDSVVEATERLFLRLSSSDSSVLVDSDADQINITIMDNDGNGQACQQI